MYSIAGGRVLSNLEEVELDYILNCPGGILDGKLMTEPKANFFAFQIKNCPVISYRELWPLMHGKRLSLRRNVLLESYDPFIQVEAGKGKGKVDGGKLVVEDSDLNGGKIYFTHSFPHNEDRKMVNLLGLSTLKHVGGASSTKLRKAHGIGSAVFIASEKGCKLALHREDFALASENLLFFGEKIWIFLKPQYSRCFRELAKKIIQENKDDQFVEDILKCKDPFRHKSLLLNLARLDGKYFEKVYQKPGQVFLIPGNVLHQVEATKNSVAVSFNVVDKSWLEMMDRGEEKMDFCDCKEYQVTTTVIRQSLAKLKECYTSQIAYAIALGCDKATHIESYSGNPFPINVKKHDSNARHEYRFDHRNYQKENPVQKKLDAFPVQEKLLSSILNLAASEDESVREENEEESQVIGFKSTFFTMPEELAILEEPPEEVVSSEKADTLGGDTFSESEIDAAVREHADELGCSLNAPPPMPDLVKAPSDINEKVSAINRASSESQSKRKSKLKDDSSKLNGMLPRKIRKVPEKKSRDSEKPGPKRIRIFSMTNCKICGQECNTNNINRHMRTIHAAEKKFQCTRCGKYFNRKDQAMACARRAEEKEANG